MSSTRSLSTPPTVENTHQLSFAARIGLDGASAYHVAVADGFIGTEAEWLESLKKPAMQAATKVEVDFQQFKTEANSSLEQFTEAAAADVSHTITAAQQTVSSIGGAEQNRVVAETAREQRVQSVIDQTVTAIENTNNVAAAVDGRLAEIEGQLTALEMFRGLIYGVERPRGVADPNFYTWIGREEYKTTLPLHSKQRLCKSNAEGRIVNYLSQTDITKNEDGSTALLDGSDGCDVMVHCANAAVNPDGQRGMWVVNGGTHSIFERYIVGDSPFIYDGDSAVWVEEFLHSADLCTIEASTLKLRCVRNETADFAGSGSKVTAGGLGYPRTETSRFMFETYAENAGGINSFTGDLEYISCMIFIELRTKNIMGHFDMAAAPMSGNVDINGFPTTRWVAYNGNRPVFKILEAHLALSGSDGVVGTGAMTGVYSKPISINTDNAPLNITLKNLVWRGIGSLTKHCHWFRSGYEISTTSDLKFNVYRQTDPRALDANRIDTSFAFEQNYKAELLGAVRERAYAKTTTRDLLLAETFGAELTTYEAMNTQWVGATSRLRRTVAFGGTVDTTYSSVRSSITQYSPNAKHASCGSGIRRFVKRD